MNLGKANCPKGAGDSVRYREECSDSWPHVSDAMQITPHLRDMSKFSDEALKRYLSIAEAACLWCDLPFAVLQGALIHAGIPGHPDYPQLGIAADALCDATNFGELHTQHDEDGFPVDYEDRIINRDDLIAWLKQYHPEHRPASLFGSGISRAGAQPARAQVGISSEEPQISVVSAVISATQVPPSKAASKLLKIKQVQDLTGLSRTGIYEKMKSGDFPKQIKIGGLSRWAESEVIEWNECEILASKCSDMELRRDECIPGQGKK